MIADKRKYHRWECSLPCSCEGEGLHLQGNTIDLSFDGACVAESTAVPREGSDVMVTFMKDAGLISLMAHVVYHRIDDRVFGLQFYGPPVERGQKLVPLFRQYIDEER